MDPLLVILMLVNMAPADYVVHGSKLMVHYVLLVVEVQCLEVLVESPKLSQFDRQLVSGFPIIHHMKYLVGHV